MLKECFLKWKEQKDSTAMDVILFSFSVLRKKSRIFRCSIFFFCWLGAGEVMCFLIFTLDV